MFIIVLFTIAKVWKKLTAHSVEEWIKKIYALEYHSAFTKKEILSFATTWMKLEGTMQREISQTEEDKNCMVHGVTYMCNLKKNQINLTEISSWG